MEEKIYDRQVTKQSLFYRVVDQQQIERHFTLSELTELYTFEPDLLDVPNSKKSKRTTSVLPKVTICSFKFLLLDAVKPDKKKELTMLNVFPRLLSQDKVLMQLLETCKEQIVSFHEHESLLDHKEEEELSEAERKAAWAEYEAEVKLSRVERDLVVEVTRASALYFYINVFFFPLSQTQPAIQSARARILWKQRPMNSYWYERM